MRTSIAIISALAATAAANVAYSTVDVTITSCAPEVSSCPGRSVSVPQQAQTVYETVDVTITSCGPEVTSCPGKPSPPASYPPGGQSIPVPLSSVPKVTPTGAMTPTIPSPYTSIPPAPPASSVPVVQPSPPVEQTPVPSVRVTSVAPYPSVVVTVVTSVKPPMGTGTGVMRPSTNATATQPPIASYTGAASSISGSFGAVAGLAAIAAFFMA